MDSGTSGATGEAGAAGEEAEGVSGRIFVPIFGGLMLVCLIAVLAFAWQAQRRFAAVVHACRAVELYVDSHAGRWPSGWDDLTPHLEHISLARVQADVQIDFAANTERLMAEPGTIFSAIKPTGICYQAYEKPIMAVIAALKKHASLPPSPTEPGQEPK